MNNSISTPGMGAMGLVRALTGRSPIGGSGNKKTRRKLKKKINTNKNKASGRK